MIKKKKIAYLGPRGTYTEEAADFLFDNDPGIELMPYPSISDCLWATDEQTADACVVPIENSIEGSVNLTLDMLAHEVDLPIQAEVNVPISQTLYVRQEGLQLHQIEKLFSHPQAIAQCRRYIKKNLPHVQIVETKSTANACQTVRENEDKPYAAIGSRSARDLYGLIEVESCIQDYDNNITRFVLCGNALELPESGEHKTTLMVTLPENQGAGTLHQVLAAFAWRKINLTRIESRPTKKKLGNYYFFIDVDQLMDGVLLPGAMAELEALGCQVRLLGSYPSYMTNQKSLFVRD